MFGKEKTQAKLLGSLEDHFLKVHRAHQLPVGDFPDVTKFRNTMLGHELYKFPKLDLKQVATSYLHLRLHLHLHLHTHLHFHLHTHTHAHTHTHFPLPPPPPRPPSRYGCR